MSYDITFIRKARAQSWEAALEAHEARCPDEEEWDAPALERARVEWNRIAVLLTNCHPALTLFEAPCSLELSDEETGLQLSLSEASVDITIPYCHPGLQADRVMAMAKAFARIVENETGLVAYDCQRDCGLLQPAAPSPDAAEMLGTMSHKIHNEGLFTAPDEPNPPWWMFWKRR